MLLEKTDNLEKVTETYKVEYRWALIINLAEAILEKFSIDPYAKNLIAIYSLTGTESCNRRAIQIWVEKNFPKHQINNDQDPMELLYALFQERYQSFSQSLE